MIILLWELWDYVESANGSERNVEKKRVEKEESKERRKRKEKAREKEQEKRKKEQKEKSCEFLSLYVWR